MGLTRRRATKVVLSVLDQGLSSLSSFGASIILARSSTSSQFGLFALTYSVILFGMLAHQGFVVEPMLMRKHSSATERATILGVHVVFVGAALACASIVGLVLALVGADWQLVVVGSLTWAAIATFTVTRRAFYGRGKPSHAVLASVLYLVATLAGLMAVARSVPLTATLGVAILGVAAGLASIPGLVVVQRSRKPGVAHVRTLWAFHLKNGGWLAAAGLLSWVPINSFFVVLPIVSGLTSGALLRADYNLILPAQLAFGNLTFLLLPALANRVGSREAFGSLVRQSLAFVAILAGLYLGLVLAGGPWFFVHVYNGRFPWAGREMLMFAVLPLLTGSHMVFSSSLKALHDPRSVTYTFVLGAIIAVLAGVAALRAPVAGAIGAMLLAFLAMDGFLFRRLTLGLRSLPA